jgi:hypothetical protein
MLKPSEIYRLVNDYIGVEGGYLGDFSYRTHEEFYPQYCDLDIDIYSYNGTTKEKFIEILKSADKHIQSKIILGVLKKFPPELFPENRKEIKKKLLLEFMLIVKRLEEDIVPPSKQELEAHFKDIQQRILEEIDKANHLIWIAVAWVTDEKIFKSLAWKKHKGLTVELIMLDVETNRNSGLDFDKYLTVHWSKDKAKMMHNKFCIIDLKTCITGSYNWTNRAAYYNLENITIKRNTETVNDYASEFIKIRKNLII